MGLIPEPTPVNPQPTLPGEFALGPGPLTNENTVTAQPPLPVAVDPAAPYRSQAVTGIVPPLPSIVEVTEITQAKPGTIEGALEAAKMPPEPGAIVSYPCPSCGVEVKTGDVHAC